MTPRPRSRAAVCALILVLCAGCGDDFEADEYPSPGENLQIGDILLRDFRLDPPPDDPYEPYPAGSDVFMYGWIVNEGDADEHLLEASSPDAADVELVSGAGEVVQFPLPIPAESTVRMEAGELALLVKGTEQVLESGSPIDLRLVFEDAGETTVGVQVAIPAG